MALSPEQAKALALAAARRRQADASTSGGGAEAAPPPAQPSLQERAQAGMGRLAKVGTAVADVGASMGASLIDRTAASLSGAAHAIPAMMPGGQSPAEAYRGAQQAEAANPLTLGGQSLDQPRTPEGQNLAGGVNKAMSYTGIPWATEKLGQGVEAVAGPEARDFLGSAAMLATLKAPGPKKLPAGPVVHPAIADARALGLKLDPRQVVEGKPVGTTTQRAAAVLGGKAAIPADASILNQTRVRELVGEDLGLPKGESITQATIDRLRKPANAAYKTLQDLKNSSGQPYRLNLARDSQYLAAVRKIGADATSGVSRAMDPATAKLVQRYQRPANGVEVSAVMKDVADLRFDASKHFKSDDPALVRQARSERALADALEDTLDRQVGAQNPQVIAEWRAARQKLAQLHTIEDALVGTEIDARLLAKAEDSGAKLSGNAQKLAAAARNFPTVMQAGANLGSKSSLGLFDVGAAGLGGTIGALIGGLPGAMVGAAAEPAIRLGSKRVALGSGDGVRLPVQSGRQTALAASLGAVVPKDDENRKRMAARLQGR